MMKENQQPNNSMTSDQSIEQKEYVLALYDFQGEKSTDISFRQGDKIMVLKKEGNWWVGLCNDKIGNFPSNFVEQL